METMKNIIGSINSEIVPAFIGAIVGLIISVVFDESLREFKRKVKRKYKRLFSVKNDQNSHLFSFENTTTNFFVVDGDGQSEFKPENIECRVVYNEFPLTEELELIKQEITAEETEKKVNGLEYKWNGPLYGLAKYRQSRTEDREDMTVIFNFFKTDYYTFQATNMQLDRMLDSGETIREKYIPYNNLEKVEPKLANGFGVALIVITSDENVILTQRTEHSGTRGSEMDISVVEGVHPLLDRHSINDGPDLFKTAARGVHEELGIIVNKDAINFLGYGIDLDFYQWNMIGYTHVPQTAQEVKDIRSRGTSGKWEATSLVFKNFTPKEMAELIVNGDMWSTAKVALYWTAVRELGKNNIDRAIKNIS